MAYALELLFDEASSKFVRELWQQLSNEGISSHMLNSGHPPHISLAGCGDIDFEKLDVIEEFCTKAKAPRNISLSHVASFPGAAGVFFLGVTPSNELAELHSSIHEASEGILSNKSPYYLPGYWVPHCTLDLGLNPEKHNDFFRLVREWKLPVEAKPSKIAVVEHPGGSIKAEFKLNTP